MRIITSLDDLDKTLDECDQASLVSDDELRRVLQTFRMDVSAQLSTDPFSAEYANAQMALYERIAGRTYNVSNEESIFDFESAELMWFWGQVKCRHEQMKEAENVMKIGAAR